MEWLFSLEVTFGFLFANPLLVGFEGGGSRSGLCWAFFFQGLPLYRPVLTCSNCFFTGWGGG